MKTGHDCGWNDTEYGINNWTGGSRWETPLQWALEMREIAQQQKAKALPTSRSYFDGVIDAVTEFQKTGVIRRKGTP